MCHGSRYNEWSKPFLLIVYEYAFGFRKDSASDEVIDSPGSLEGIVSS